MMQSDGNSFSGEIVLENVNMVSRVEDSILDQINEYQIFIDLYNEDFE